MKRKVSPRLLKATEKYLDTLGSSGEQLTDEQWKVVVRFVRSWRVAQPIIASLLIMGLLLLAITFLYSNWTKKEIAKAIPSETVYFYKAGDKIVVPVRPDEIKDYLESLSNLSFNTSPAFILAVFCFLFVIIIPLWHWTKRKILEAFIRHRKEPKAISGGEPSSD